MRLLVSIALTAILLWSILSQHSLEQLLIFVSGVSLPGVGCYFSISVLALYLRAKRYQIALEHGSADSSSNQQTLEQLSTTQALVVTAIRNALVDFLPARLGELSFFYVLRHYNIAIIRAIAAFGICLALDIIALLALVIVLFAAEGSELLRDISNTSPAVIIGGTTILLAVLAVLLQRLDHIVRFVASALSKMVLNQRAATSKITRALIWTAEKLVDISTSLSEIKQRGSYLKLVSLSLLLRMAKYGSLYLLLLAVVAQWGIGSKDIAIVISTAAFLIAEAAASTPFSGLMGFGAYEGAWAIFFQLSPVAIPHPATTVLLVHLISQVLGYSLAVVALLVFALCSRSDQVKI